MNYFREKLLTYSTERQISTLLHIHTEISKQKVQIPTCKTKNYVDEILNDYSVKMYTYPELSVPQNRLAYGIQNQKKLGANIFNLEQFKRKPLKKKISKKIVLPPPPPPIPQTTLTQNYKICPCCQTKVSNKHRCDHSLCQKPCSRIRKPRGAINSDQKSLALSKKKKTEEQQDFTPEGQGNEVQQSKSSALDHESDFQDEMEVNQFSGTESFLSNIDRKRGKTRKRSRRDGNRNRTNRRRKGEQQRRTNTRSQNLKRQQKMQGQVQNEGENISPSNNFDQRQEQEEEKEKPNTRKKKLIKKADKKQSHHTESNIESQFEPNSSPKKELRRKRSSGTGMGMVKRTSMEQEKESYINNDGEIVFRFKKRQLLSYFCSAEQLKQDQIFNIKIIDQPTLQQKKRPSQKQPTQKQKQRPQLSLLTGKYQQPLQPKLQKHEKSYNSISYSSQNQKMDINLNGTQLKNKQSSQLSENGQYQQQPVVNAVLDPVSDQEGEDDLFKSSEDG